MSKKKITEIVAGMLETFLQENGFSLWDCEYVKEGPDHYLRVYIDRLDGEYISTDDCELVSRFLDGRLDEEDPIPENYILEVSSPGLDRALTKEEHFAAYQGAEVDVKLYRQYNGSKEITGILGEVTEDTVSLTAENGETVKFPRKDIAKIRLTVVF